jgi:multiple sugar transport system substrate-binding protein/sn-glycerol 3-phosphate transport system substrate-binding protein
MLTNQGDKTIMNKLALMILLLFALGLGMAGAQGGTDYESIDPSGQTVVYWHQYTEDSSQGDTMARLVEDFNSTNEYGITVEALHQGSYGPIEDLMNTAILSGELPNMVAGYANAVAGWADEGVVVDINLLLNSPQWGIPADEQALLNFDLLDVNQLDFPPFHGMRVAWANQNSLNVFYTNLDIVEALGFERRVPTTLAKFEEISCAAGASDMYQGYPLDTGTSHFESFVAAHGGAIFDGEAGDYIFESEAVVDTMELFARMLENNCAYLFAERYQNTGDFAIGITPFAAGSSAGIPFITWDAATAEMTDAWVVTAFPGAEGVGATIQLFVPSQAILTATPEAELATWLFVKYLAGVDAQLAWSGATGYFSIRNDIEVTEADFTEPRMPYARFIEVSGILSDESVSVYSSPGLPSYSAVRGIVPNVIAEVVNGDAAAADALAELNAEAAELHEELDA